MVTIYNLNMAINVFTLVLSILYTLLALYNTKRGIDKNYYLGLIFILLIIPMITYLPFLRVSKEDIENKEIKEKLNKEIKALDKDYKTYYDESFLYHDNIYEGFYEFIREEKALIKDIEELIKRLNYPLKINNLRGDNIDINSSLKDHKLILAHLSKPFYNADYLLIYSMDQNMRYKIYMPRSSYLSHKIYSEEILSDIDYYWVVARWRR